MADFCQQCSIEEFGEDFRDLAIGDEAREGDDRDANSKPNDRYVVLCEGCSVDELTTGGVSYTVVDPDGKCVVDCTSHHGAETMETWEGSKANGVLPS